MSGLSEQFGQVVRRERESKGISQERLAQLAELDRTFVQRLEGGKHSPSLESIERIAGALQMFPSELIALSDGSEADEAEEEAG
jgi:transcriptional regulator with XRE-family HTH domain